MDVKWLGQREEGLGGQEMDDLLQGLSHRPRTRGNRLDPAPTAVVLQATARAHLKDGVLHITDLYAVAVVCWFAGQECFEPEREHEKRKRRTHSQLARNSALSSPNSDTQQ